MSKKVNDVNKFIEDRKQKQKDALEKIEAEIAGSRSRLNAIEAEMDNASTADRYRDLARAKIDETAMIEFFEMRKKAVEADLMTSEEYKEITGVVKTAFDTLKTDTIKKIRPAVTDLVKIFDEYFKQAEEYNVTLRDLGSLAKRNPELIAPGFIVNNADLYDPCKYFMQAYHQYKQVQNTLNR